MVATITTNKILSEKIYAKDHPNSCVVDVDGDIEFTISMASNDLECNMKREALGGTSCSKLLTQANKYPTGDHTTPLFLLTTPPILSNILLMLQALLSLPLCCCHLCYRISSDCQLWCWSGHHRIAKSEAEAFFGVIYATGAAPLVELGTICQETVGIYVRLATILFSLSDL